MIKTHFYRFLSHITYGKWHKKYRKKYKEMQDSTDMVPLKIQEIVQNLNHLTDVVNNMDFKQNLFLDYFVNPADALPATGALAKRQAQNLYLLKTFVAICKKHKLDYWLDFGTLLGAVRHGGFVPWDDDIDVAMRREDIVKFRDVFMSEQKTDVDFLFWMGEQSRMVFKNDTGAFLDIYAYDKLDDKLHPVPVFPIKSYNTLIPDNFIYPFSKVEFCGFKFNAPHDPDLYLRMKYGNYNVLPKKTHAVGGHNALNEYSGE